MPDITQDTSDCSCEVPDKAFALKKIKVVQVAWDWINENGGAAQSIANFQKALGSFVVSFTRESGSPYQGSEEVKQLHIPYHENSFNRYAYTRSPLKKQAEQELAAADLIICHGFFRYHFDWAVSIAKRNNIPYWIIPHGSLDPYVFTYRTIAKKLWFALKGNKSFADARAFVFATESEKEKARSFAPLTRSHVIHWPVKFVDTVSRDVIRAEIRNLLGIPSTGKVLLFIGRFHPVKRPFETIRALAACTVENVFLLMVGPDSDVLTGAECEKYCKDNNINNVRCLKPVYGRDKFKYYMAVDAFISLSHKENFGYTVAEALSSGIPVIISPGNDLGKDIRHLNCGWLLTDDHPESASKAVAEFAVTPTRQLVEMGARGQEWARAELSPERFRSQLRALALETVATADRQNDGST